MWLISPKKSWLHIRIGFCCHSKLVSNELRKVASFSGLPSQICLYRIKQSGCPNTRRFQLVSSSKWLFSIAWKQENSGARHVFFWLSRFLLAKLTFINFIHCFLCSQDAFWLTQPCTNIATPRWTFSYAIIRSEMQGKRVFSTRSCKSTDPLDNSKFTEREFWIILT